MPYASLSALDQSVSLLREGYLFLTRERQRRGTDIVDIRLLGRPVTCLVGADAARLLYDTSRFQRAGALPGRVRRTLVGSGGVQHLDDEAHARRKALFLGVLAPEAVTRRPAGPSCSTTRPGPCSRPPASGPACRWNTPRPPTAPPTWWPWWTASWPSAPGTGGPGGPGAAASTWSRTGGRTCGR